MYSPRKRKTGFRKWDLKLEKNKMLWIWWQEILRIQLFRSPQVVRTTAERRKVLRRISLKKKKVLELRSKLWGHKKQSKFQKMTILILKARFKRLHPGMGRIPFLQQSVKGHKNRTENRWAIARGWGGRRADYYEGIFYINCSGCHDYAFIKTYI